MGGARMELINCLKHINPIPVGGGGGDLPQTKLFLSFQPDNVNPLHTLTETKICEQKTMNKKVWWDRICKQ